MNARRTRGSRWALGAIVVALLISLCTACAGQTISGKAQSADSADPGTVGGMPVTNGQSGLKPGVSTAQLPVPITGGDGGQMDQLVEDSLSDIWLYWSKEMPQAFGKQFSPPKTLISYDSSASPGETICGGVSTKGFENALFCPDQNAVVWDRGVLLPQLVQQFGQLSVPTVLAHEMGHAVQFALGTVNQATPSIVREQQADCYSGAFMHWAAQGNAPHFNVSTGDGLSQSLASLFFVRDPVGSTPSDTQAHGDAFDRTTAFEFGFDQGPTRCNKINYKEIQQRITELGFSQESQSQNNNNVPVDQQTVGLLKQSLQAAFKQNANNPPQIVAGTGSCGNGGPSTPPVSYCPSDNTINADASALTKLAQLPQDDRIGIGDGSLGDFAAFAEIASRYTLSVQQALKIPLDDNNAGLRTACLTGSWAGVVRHRYGSGTGDELLIGAGDLDEAVAEMLGSKSVIAADVNGKQVPSGFARVQAFQVGFLHGSGTCASQYSSS